MTTIVKKRLLSRIADLTDEEARDALNTLTMNLTTGKTTVIKDLEDAIDNSKPVEVDEVEDDEVGSRNKVKKKEKKAKSSKKRRKTNTDDSDCEPPASKRRKTRKKEKSQSSATLSGQADEGSDDEPSAPKHKLKRGKQDEKRFRKSTPKQPADDESDDETSTEKQKKKTKGKSKSESSADEPGRVGNDDPQRSSSMPKKSEDGAMHARQELIADQNVNTTSSASRKQSQFSNGSESVKKQGQPARLAQGNRNRHGNGGERAQGRIMHQHTIQGPNRHQRDSKHQHQQQQNKKQPQTPVKGLGVCNTGTETLSKSARYRGRRREAARERVNTGHTVQLPLTPESNLSVSGASLPKHIRFRSATPPLHGIPAWAPSRSEGHSPAQWPQTADPKVKDEPDVENDVENDVQIISSRPMFVGGKPLDQSSQPTLPMSSGTSALAVPTIRDEYEGKCQYCKQWFLFSKNRIGSCPKPWHNGIQVRLDGGQQRYPTSSLGNMDSSRQPRKWNCCNRPVDPVDPHYNGCKPAEHVWEGDC